MRFLDANVFIYAYYKQRATSSDDDKLLKNHAKRIIQSVNQGEPVVTTVVHLSEVSNILKRSLSVEENASLILGLLEMENIQVEGVDRETYLMASDFALEESLTPNDALAVETMRRLNIDEIYSFDKDFDKLGWIRRLSSVK